MAGNHSGQIKSRVVVAQCPDYTPALVDRAVESILTQLEPLPFRPGQRVLLKPNCLSSTKGPDLPVNTRAEVVEAVGKYLKDRHRASLLIADSGGLGSYGRAAQTYALMGLDKVAQRLGADLVNLEAAGLKEYQSPEGQILTSFQATALLDRVHAVLSLPKLKTHMLTGLTGAVKNLLGLLPGGLKRALHTTAPKPVLMARALNDIYAAVRPCLSLMDAVVAMEGEGPSQGRPKRLNRLIGSLDGVALDAVAAAMMGFKPGELEILENAARRGLGATRREEIDLVGADWETLCQGRFKPPLAQKLALLQKLLPASLSGLVWDRLTEARPRPVPDRCQRCELCVEACPADALRLEETGLALDPERCIECYCCLEHCPADALRLPRGLWDRLLTR